MCYKNVTVQTSVLIFTTTPLASLYIKFQSTQSPYFTEFKGVGLIITEQLIEKSILVTSNIFIVRISPEI